MSNVVYLTELLIEDILQFHVDLENSTIPVDNGIRDMSLLESAVNAPFQTFCGEDLIPDLLDKAARLCYGLVNNHAFVDGNKRVAVHAMEMFLILNGYNINCSDYELEKMIIGIADSKVSYEQFAEWLKKHTDH